MDWEDTGLKVGIEIHQQLGMPGSRKLFCNCPAEIIEGEPDNTITRRLRASAGELGDIDIAAAAEQAKRKRFVYQAHSAACCLVELDEEPPHPVNEEALETSIMVAKAFGSTVLPKVQFMRKTIIDGSNVSGFQRTGLVAFGGDVPGLPFAVGIQTIGLEEDSARIVSRTSSEDAYNLSRLGIPLIEIATAPDISTPQQAKETAAQIGMVLRSTGRVKRGLGTIRQDLNVSVRGGTRTELKGCQDLRLLPTLVEYEARRQQGLLDVKALLEERGDAKVSDLFDVTDKFRESSKGFIRKAIGKGQKAVGFCVDHFDGIFGKELCPGYRVGSELADIAKAWGFGGIIHSDETLEKYGLPGKMEDLREYFTCEPRDGFIIILGMPDEIARLVEHGILPRLRQFASGVPAEVRKANDDGTTSHLRPMPGGARMYPETDIPIVHTDVDAVSVPKLLTEQAEELADETGLSKDVVGALLEHNISIKEYKERFPTLEYRFLSSALVEWPREIESRLGTRMPSAAEYVERLFPLVAEGTIAGASVKAILEEIGVYLREKGGAFPVEDLDGLASKYQQMSEDALREIVKRVCQENPDASVGALMGDIMNEIKGKADGKTVMRILKEECRS